MFHHIVKGTAPNDVLKMAESLRRNYQYEIQRCQAQIDFIVSILPPEWEVPSLVLKEKLQQLMDVQWVDAVWNNFVSLLNENL